VLPDLPLPDGAFDAVTSNFVIKAAGVPWPDDIPVPPLRPHSSPDAFAALIAGAGFAKATARLRPPLTARSVQGKLTAFAWGQGARQAHPC